MEESSNFGELLDGYMKRTFMGSQRIATVVNDQFGSIVKVPRNTIRHWRDGSSRRVQDWRQLAAVAAVLRLSAKEADTLFRAAGIGSLADLHLQATSEEKRLLAQWPQPSDVPGATPEKMPIPPLLPYLVNRLIQDEAFEQALNAYLQGTRRRPFICIVHGNEMQCHDKYLDRLLQVVLPEKINKTVYARPIKEYAVAWPENLTQLPGLHNQLRKNLSYTLLGHRDAQLNDINHELARIPAPVLLHTTVIVRDWKSHGPGLLKYYLQFWQGWPDITSKQPLVVCLFIKYQSIQRQHMGVKLWPRRTIETQIHEHLAELSRMSLPRLHCAILPQLLDITRQDVENWANSAALRRYRHHNNLFGDLRQIFDVAEADVLPMELVVQELKRVLESYQEKLS